MARRRRHRLQLALFPADAFAATAVEEAPVGAALTVETLVEPAQQPAAVVPVVPTVAAPQATADTPQPLRPHVPEGLRSADARRMVWLRAQGASLTALAAQFHTSRQLVQRYTQDPMRIRELEEREEQARRGADRT